MFNADADWSDMSGWTTFWQSTFSPSKYKKNRDAEVAEGLQTQYRVDDGMSCGKLNQRIDDIENKFDKTAATTDDMGRGETRMQARTLKGLEPILNTAYNLAEDKCCEYSVCDSNKNRGRPSGDDNGDSDNGDSPREQFGNLKNETDHLLGPPPAAKAGMSSGMKIGLGVGGAVILFGMAYLIFKNK